MKGKLRGGSTEKKSGKANRGSEKERGSWGVFRGGPNAQLHLVGMKEKKGVEKGKKRWHSSRRVSRGERSSR